MGLDMALGKRRDLRDAPGRELADQLRVDTPILNAAELAKVEGAAKTVYVSTLYPISTGPEGLEAAVQALVKEAEAQVCRLATASDPRAISPSDRPRVSVLASRCAGARR